MSNSRHSNSAVSRSRPWPRVALIVAVLGATVFAFPRGFVTWLEERNGSGWLAAPLGVARGVEAVSAALGVEGVGERLRKRFAAGIGEDGA